MYLQKVISRKNLKIKLVFFVGILKVNDENSRIRIQDPDPLVRDMDPRIWIRIRTKMSWIRNTTLNPARCMLRGFSLLVPSQARSSLFTEKTYAAALSTVAL
jgi:hypothetical protein